MVARRCIQMTIGGPDFSSSLPVSLELCSASCDVMLAESVVNNSYPILRWDNLSLYSNFQLLFEGQRNLKSWKKLIQQHSHTLTLGVQYKSVWRWIFPARRWWRTEAHSHLHVQQFGSLNPRYIHNLPGDGLASVIPIASSLALWFKHGRENSPQLAINLWL